MGAIYNFSNMSPEELDLREKMLDIKIKDWYRRKYPTDEMWLEIEEKSTFRDLFTALDTYKSAYQVIGVYDSVVRMRVFTKLADIMNESYDVVYNQWILGDD